MLLSLTTAMQCGPNSSLPSTRLGLNVSGAVEFRSSRGCPRTRDGFLFRITCPRIARPPRHKKYMDNSNAFIRMVLLVAHAEGALLSITMDSAVRKHTSAYRY